MPAPDWENLGDFLDDDEFAVQATLHLQSGDRPVTVIYDNPYLNAELGEYDLDTENPRVGGSMTDFADVQRGDSITIGTTTLDILTGPQDDGAGWGTLQLAQPAS